ncbi:hypothetical protein DRN69_04055 [Candidatus Pacearchaeota archaeon]|nr:MAG: hypothetical protein DRN69_04055 [Candidatus Pacearchaeota archaeon]
MKIMLDLDGTLFPTYDELDILHKAVFGKEINWEALKDGEHAYWETEQGKWVRKMFRNDLFYAELRAYKGAREVLRIFMRNPKNEILYCTARDSSLEEATAYSLGLNQLPYGDLIFVERKDVHLNKLDIVVIECPDVVIDDEPKILFAVKDNCLVTIIYTQDYNKKYPFGLRADNWLEVGEHLKFMQGGEMK